MNYWELMFVVMACAIGTGLGIGCAEKHGILGFILGFAGGIVFVFLLLGLVVWLAPKRVRRLTARERNK